MASWRCSICNLEWPPESPYERCPECGEETWPNRDGKPEKDARKRSDEAWRGRREQAQDVETKVKAFRDWLDTVTADDFKSYV